MAHQDKEIKKRILKIGSFVRPVALTKYKSSRAIIKLSGSRIITKNIKDHVAHRDQEIKKRIMKIGPFV